jgi:hypothetical protein
MMKKMTILAVSVFVSICLGCQTTGGISRERAIEIATEKAVAEGWKPNEYVIEWVKPMTFQGKNYWDIFFEGNVQTVGNHFGVWVDRQTGETTLFPGM